MLAFITWIFIFRRNNSKERQMILFLFIYIFFKMLTHTHKKNVTQLSDLSIVHYEMPLAVNWRHKWQNVECNCHPQCLITPVASAKYLWRLQWVTRHFKKRWEKSKDIYWFIHCHSVKSNFVLFVCKVKILALY